MKPKVAFMMGGSHYTMAFRSVVLRVGSEVHEVKTIPIMILRFCFNIQSLISV